MKKRYIILLAVLGVCVVSVVFGYSTLHSPYNVNSAKRLYFSRQDDFDAVAVGLVELEPRDRIYYSVENREQWPAGISDALERLLTRRPTRTGYLFAHQDELAGKEAVFFSLYTGSWRDSGDGGKIYDAQYLLYLSDDGAPNFQNCYTEKAEPIAEHWYLYSEVVF